MHEELVKKARARVAQCRRLADYTSDEHTKRVLLQMAEEAEGDLRKFEADQGDQDNERREG